MALTFCFYYFNINIPFLRLVVLMVVVMFLEGTVMLNFANDLLLSRFKSFLRAFRLVLSKKKETLIRKPKTEVLMVCPFLPSRAQ